MPKRGNSNTEERIQLVEQYIQLFGKQSINYLVADREFVGEKWIKYLNANWIEYHIRIRENFLVLNPKTGKRIKASWLFFDLKLNQVDYKHQIYYVNNQLCYLSASKTKNKDGKPELQIVVSFCKPECAQKIYKERWQIESAFKALKTSGFNIEDTHLTDIERIEKLLALVLIAFTWSYLAGIYLHENVKPIKTLKHGRKAKSFVKYGLIFIAKTLFFAEKQYNMNIFEFLSYT
jgi:IS4 transposase